MTEISQIRCGKFAVQVGVLRLSEGGAQTTLEANIGQPIQADVKRNEMPVLVIGWLGTGYLPFFHSLN